MFLSMVTIGYFYNLPLLNTNSVHCAHPMKKSCQSRVNEVIFTSKYVAPVSIALKKKVKTARKWHKS